LNEEEIVKGVVPAGELQVREKGMPEGQSRKLSSDEWEAL
jgi:hypothetical protein